MTSRDARPEKDDAPTSQGMHSLHVGQVGRGRRLLRAGRRVPGGAERKAERGNGAVPVARWRGGARFDVRSAFGGVGSGVRDLPRGEGHNRGHER